jgi:hypothetical protein
VRFELRLADVVAVNQATLVESAGIRSSPTGRRPRRSPPYRRPTCRWQDSGAPLLADSGSDARRLFPPEGERLFCPVAAAAWPDADRLAFIFDDAPHPELSTGEVYRAGRRHHQQSSYLGALWAGRP